MTKKTARFDLNLSIGTKIMIVVFFIFTILICTCSYQGLATEKERILDSYSEHIEQSEIAITTAVTLVSRGTMVLSSIYDTPMADGLNHMKAAYAAAGNDPAGMDLWILRDQIQENFTDEVHLYIIDKENAIIDTTDIVHLGRDFSEYPTIAERLTAIRKGTTYVGDPWERSVLDPETIRKYAYLPTPDHQYILEIGLYNEQLADPDTLYFSFGDVTDSLETADNSIESVLIVGTNGVFVEKSPEEMEKWYASHPYINQEEISTATAQVLRTGEGIEKTFPDQKRLVHIFYIDPGHGTHMPSDKPYSALVVYSTEELSNSLSETLIRYLLILVVGLIFAAGMAYIVAYTLGRPVRMIAEDVDEIAKGNLAHEIRRTNGFELRQLEDSIRILVIRLGDDLTEIHRQKQDLDTELIEKKEVERRLRDANRKLSLLSTVTRHDVLNQLGVLGMYCDLMGDITDRCPGLSDYISRMEHSLKKIERQLTFARDYESMGLEDPKFQFLSDVVEDAIASLRAPYLRFSVETDGVEICADKMLEKVFYNLFENAIRHGGEELSDIVVTFTGIPGETGHITVTDNGNGIATPKKERIFQQGYGSNTGYGLFLVREILAITNISIRECGTEGKGARFELDVPPASWRLSSGTE
ncbi:sensor histidine kinase [Methanogenium organophilum]|uniref:histidine kinase n=1 Tax=Methanogenium organophilum TaxID=2199 RepID=A0A9X9S671_METOG|nr:HAMP domain-containing sensor histidine kinase [Methanogenium organophilum]WAI02447.1 HAMP domain-containing sensor histidine kinase [Methanogenium organophilum]